MIDNREDLDVHHYPFHIGDYRKDTGSLTLLEHGVYRSLMDCYYLKETPLTSDKDKLCRSIGARSAEEKQAVSDILSDFFVLYDDGYRHNGCDKVLSSIYGKSEKARIAVEKRWEKHRENTLTKNNGNTDVSKKHTDVSKKHTDCILPITHNPTPINNNNTSSSAGEAFVMSLDWLPNMPNHDLESLCQLRGITAVDPLDPALLDEFRRYWAARGDPKTDAQWLNQWIKNLSRQQTFLAMDGAKLKIAIEKQGARNASRIDPCQQAATEYLRSQGFGREDFFEIDGSDGAQVYEQLGNA